MNGYDIKGIGTAVRFLTIFKPEGSSSDLTRGQAAAALPFFPVAGLVAGAVAAAAMIVLTPLAGSELVRAIFAVATLAVVTRALHLDGIGDCFDALHYFGDREKAFAVMKDKSLGSFGVAAVAFVIVAKIIALGSVSHGLMLSSVVAVPAMARFGPVVVSYFSKSVSHNGAGLGSMFNFGGEQGARGIVARAAVTAFLISLMLCGFAGIGIVLVVSVTAFLLVRFFKSAFGDANGDVHGAVIEICEVAGFIAAGRLL